MKKLLLATLLLASFNSLGQTPIRTIIPFGIGGPNDIVARQLANNMNEFKLIIENKPGASGNIGYQYFIDSCKDFPCLLFTSTSYSGNRVLKNGVNEELYNVAEPLVYVGESPLILWRRADLKVSKLQDLKKKNQYSIGHGGAGTSNWLASNSIVKVFLQDSIVVPYKSIELAATDVASGRIDLVSTFPTTMLGHYKSGKVQPVVIFMDKRWDKMPTIPTAKEQGLNINISGWMIMFVHKNTPINIKERIKREFIISLKSNHQKYEELGITNILGVQDFDKFFKEQEVLYKRYK